MIASILVLWVGLASGGGCRCERDSKPTPPLQPLPNSLLNAPLNHFLLLGQDAPARAVGLDHGGAHGHDVDVSPARQVGAELGVADQQVGRRFDRWA